MQRRKGWGANINTLTQLYVQYIRPILEHGAVVTAVAIQYQTDSIDIAERKALRIILGAPPWYRIEDLYAETGIQPIKERLEKLRGEAITRFGDREGIR